MLSSAPSITRPTLLLNTVTCRENIRRMAEKARRLGLRFRPHFKTHVSVEIGRWFREEGVDAITVSSVRMATYFAHAGWNDITLAFPVNLLELEAINTLASRIQLNLLVESPEVVHALSERLDVPVRLWVKIDIGNKRAGLQPAALIEIDAVLAAIESAEKIEFAGFLGHAGQTYQAKNVAEIQQLHQESLQPMQQLRAHYKERFPALEISVGDTPGCSQGQDFTGVDEIRPGNFVFYDLMQWQTGACTVDQIAVAMACPIVAIHPDRNELVVYGGAIHFSKDRLRNASGMDVFGQLVENTGLAWGQPVEGAYLKKVSQEHGIVHAPIAFLQQCKVGNLLKILPVHSCLTANLMGAYQTLEGSTIDRLVG